MKLKWGKESVQLVWTDSLDFEEHTWELDWSRNFLSFHWTRWNYVAMGWMGREYRYWGYDETWYDGPWYSFGLGLFNVSWDFT